MALTRCEMRTASRQMQHVHLWRVVQHEHDNCVCGCCITVYTGMTADEEKVDGGKVEVYAERMVKIR